MRREAWLAITLAVLVGAAIGGAVAIAGTDSGTGNGTDIFQGAPTGPTPSDQVQAQIDAYADEVRSIYSGLIQMAAAGTPECGPTTMCYEPPESRLVTLLQRCNRSGFPDDNLLKGQTNKAQALIGALNSACGRAISIKDNPPTADADWVAFAKVSLPELEDAYKVAMGRAINDYSQWQTK